MESPNNRRSSSTQATIFKIDWGPYAIMRLIGNYGRQFENILDIGSGEGEHKRFLQYFGKKVLSVDLVKNADFVGNFLEIDFDRQFDAVWCSHVLEHQRNVGAFLDKIFDVLKEDGILAITVPIHARERLVSGHLTSWSVPLLCYNLIMAGFDCSRAEILLTFELSLIVRKRLAEHSELRKTSAHGEDAGVEFGEISKYFPFNAVQGMEVKRSGAINCINWQNPMTYRLPKRAGSSHDIVIQSKNFAAPNLVPKIEIEDESSTAV